MATSTWRIGVWGEGELDGDGVVPAVGVPPAHVARGAATPVSASAPTPFRNARRPKRRSRYGFGSNRGASASRSVRAEYRFGSGESTYRFTGGADNSPP